MKKSILSSVNVNIYFMENKVTHGLVIAALTALLLTFANSAIAVTEAELEAVKREAEYAKAKADIAEQQARETKANAERMRLEKGMPKASVDAATKAVPPSAEPKDEIAAPRPKPSADPKNPAPKK